MDYLERGAHQVPVMRSLVVGFGSIGQRHARLLEALGCPVAVVSRRTIAVKPCYSDIPSALAEWKPGYVVLAGKTAEHQDDLAALAAAGFTGRVLIEKPLFDRVRPLPEHRFSHVAIAYNLRFHPLVAKLREFLAKHSPVSVAHIYVGQYLPQWRPDTDYRLSYSARRDEGGGVLRDLSHELDYCRWLFGPWLRLSAIGGHFSPLEIDSDDVFSLLMTTTGCPTLTVNLNYLDRHVRRKILVHTHNHSVCVDLVRGIFELDGKPEAAVVLERDHTYLAEHRAMLAGDMSILCSLEEGAEILSTIDAAETASREGICVFA